VKAYLGAVPTHYGALDTYPGAEVGKVTLKSNGDEALRDESL
jgi:hypothetical protein